MTDIERFLTIYGHSDNLLNNKLHYMAVTEFFRAYFTVISNLADTKMQGLHE